jgi:serine/threonine protein kinase
MIHHINKFIFTSCGLEKKLLLDWSTQMKICVGVAHGLAYLHEDLDTCIIHRNIKAPNILLDRNLNAENVDFGLAKLFS